MTVIDFEKAKKKLKDKKEKNLEDKPDFQERMNRIRQSLSNINKLLDELRNKEKKENLKDQEKDEI